MCKIVHVYVTHCIVVSRTKWSNDCFLDHEFQRGSPAGDRSTSVGEVSTVMCSSLHAILYVGEPVSTIYTPDNIVVC